MAFTIPQIIDIAKISQYLSSNDIRKSGLYGGGQDLLLPRKIRNIRKDVEYWYDLDSSDDTLVGTANYLYAMCGKYSLAAAQILGTGGGSVSPINPTGSFSFPIKITQTAFTDSLQPTLYPNTSLDGVNLMVFMNTINRYLEDNEFHTTSEGLFIDIAGFDPTQFDYLIQIDKVYNG